MTTKAKTSKYQIQYHAGSKKTEAFVEASDMGLLCGEGGVDSGNETLVTWLIGKRVVFAIPFRNFISSGVVTSGHTSTPKIEKQPERPKLLALPKS